MSAEEAPLSEPDANQPTAQLFSALPTRTARLIRCTDPPSPTDLTADDLVICQDVWGVDGFVKAATSRGAHVRTGNYRYEVEDISTAPTPPRTRNGPTRSIQYGYTTALDRPGNVGKPGKQRHPRAVHASLDSFAQTWDALSAPPAAHPKYVQADELVPTEWVPYLPYPTLNPAQSQATARVLQPGGVIIVAPTGAGKTMIGMIAALREIKQQGGKAAWLVPQRSLTAELDRELDVWRKAGLKVVALSGEASTDARLTKEADLWVATTEKFEALCRATSMKDAVAAVGTLIVDEIHLLGEPNRGPMLETLLARIKNNDQVRLVGLSATASNAQEVADWLESDLVEIAWRPTRLTQQVLTIPTGDRAQEGRYRNAVATKITADVTAEGGSTLVFCGAKANVRSTALAIASSRGVDVSGVDVGDVAVVADACTQAGIGIHYSDWPHKREAEKQFRDRKTNVLVATSTLAAGVNTPARVVIVRDTSIGPNPMEVSMIQQMFGRAGRAGKEPEGWSFLIATESETSDWRTRLADGYTIRSGVADSLADHLLAEIVQGNIRTLREAEKWWLSTLAYHQGDHSHTAITTARDFLDQWRFIDVQEEPEADQSLAATPVGSITSKMMVSVSDAANLIATTNQVRAPRSAGAAEDAVIQALATSVAALSNTLDAPPEQAPAVEAIIAARGEARHINPQPPRSTSRNRRAPAALVSQAGMLLAARSPRVLSTNGRHILGVTRSLLNAALYDSPRYFAWLAAVGEARAVQPWVSVAALDLGRRIAWHRATPQRGHGRLLWLCERLVKHNNAPQNVPALFTSLREQGLQSPAGWANRPKPSQCPLSEQEFAACTATPLTLSTTGSTVDSNGTVVEGDNTQWSKVHMGRGTGQKRHEFVVAFSKHGDIVGNDWMQDFAAGDDYR